MDKLKNWHELVGMTLCDITQTTGGEFDLTFTDYNKHKVNGNKHKIRFSATYDDDGVHDTVVTMQQVVTKQVVTTTEHVIDFDE